MNDLHYTITFHTDWHCGSGLSAGADVDSLVVKDTNRLPYVPGKTLKGLIREAAEDIASYRGLDIEQTFIAAFGDKKNNKGCMFFSNAELPKAERDTIIATGISQHMYRSISNTAIGEDGVAVTHSLRKTEVTVPCTLEASILDVPSELNALIIDSLHYIKRIGQNRNRGLGRCTITIKEGKV